MIMFSLSEMVSAFIERMITPLNHIGNYL